MVVMHASGLCAHQITSYGLSAQSSRFFSPMSFIPAYYGFRVKVFISTQYIFSLRFILFGNDQNNIRILFFALSLFKAFRHGHRLLFYFYSCKAA